jgi:biopolymer transport protein ExbD
VAFGEFEPRAATSPMSEINVTPLVDVMLVLLVIFIITAPADDQGFASWILPAVPMLRLAANKRVPLVVAIDRRVFT